MKNPATISLEELAASAERASIKADAEARQAGITVAGLKPKSQRTKPPAKAVAASPKRPRPELRAVGMRKRTNAA